MKKIKLLLFLLILSSCDRYMGTIDPDYTPSREVNEIFSNIQIESENLKFNLGDVIYPKSINLVLNKSNYELDKLINIDEKSTIYFFNEKIFLSKGKNIYIFEANDDNYYSNLKLDLKSDEYVLNFFEYKNSIYLITNISRIFILINENISLINDYGFYITTPPIFNYNNILIFDVFGGIYQINLDENSIQKKGDIKARHGISVNSNTYADKSNIYHLFNTGTLITFNKDENVLFDNFILQDLNILTSLGSFNELVDTPFNYNDYLYFLDRSGKISVFNPISSKILWEFDTNSTIIHYLFTNNGFLIVLTEHKIFVFSNKGSLINTYNHNKESPIYIFNAQENIYLISKQEIVSVNFDKKSENIFIKNKFTSNIDIYYQNQTIFLKDDKSLFKLSE